MQTGLQTSVRNQGTDQHRPQPGIRDHYTDKVVDSQLEIQINTTPNVRFKLPVVVAFTLHLIRILTYKNHLKLGEFQTLKSK